MKLYCLFIFLIINTFCFSQNRNSVWCFGDSAGIDFSNINNPIPISTSLDTRGTSVSISDSIGDLLFYAETRASIAGNSGLIFDKSHNIMLNGDSILGQGWYKEMIIIPVPSNDSLFYLFSIGVTNSSLPGLFYAIINTNKNGGLGEIVKKNIQLESFIMTDGLTAIKHGNGRDWWIFCRRWNTVNDEFHRHLISPSGVSNTIIQHFGTPTINGFTRLQFSPSGSKLALINYNGLLEIYDFDRCTGIVSNELTIHTEPTSLPISNFWSCEFSPNERFLYITQYNDSAYLFQYDLLSTFPATSRITLDTIINDQIGIGLL